MMFSILEGSEVNQLLTVIQYKSGLDFAYLDGCEMSPMGSRVGTLGPRLVKVFGRLWNLCKTKPSRRN